MIAPKTTKTPSFTISTMSSLCASKHSRTSGRQMPSAIAATNTAMKPLPSGRQRRRAVRGERHAEAVERLLMRADRVPERAPARHQPRRHERHRQTGQQPDEHVLEHELPPDEVVVAGRRGREREHRGQRQAVVQARLEVERVADEPRHARVRDHRGREHRVGRREQGAHQEGLGPAEVREHVGGQGHEHAGERHREHELPERQVPGLLKHLLLHLEAVAEQDHDQRDHREALDELRRRVELQHLEAALAEQRSPRRRRPRSGTGTTCARAPR